MSYILDALRRADAERERGAVPGLHTQQFGALPEDDERPKQSRLLIGAVLLLTIALVGALAWNWLGGEREKPPAPMQVLPPPVATAPAPAMPASMAALTPYPPPGARPLPSSNVSGTTAAAATPRPVARPSPVQRRETGAASSPAMTTPAGATTAAAASAPAAMAAAAPPPDRIVPLSELPEVLRRELPKLTYGGGSYSPDKASRLAFINGQVFHEGDTIAPGLVLTQVKPKGAVLSFKRWRFEIGT